MTSTAEIIKGLPYFADLPDDLLGRVCELSEQVELGPDVVIIEEGSDSEEMYVVVDGELLVTKRGPDREVELARLGRGEVVGEIALLDQAPRTATVRTTKDSLLIRVPVTAFEVLLKDSRVIRRMFRTVTSRLREIENTLRHEERMAALGRMAAQLMHELNNPAAAVGRSTDELNRVYQQLAEESAALTGGSSAAPHRAEPPPTLTSLERAEAEDALVQWFTEKAVADPWDLAPALVEAGWDAESLDQATAGMDEDRARQYARWLGLRATVEQVISEIGIGARRISELVRVVKDYSYLDQAPIQEIDPTSGIKDTLILLKHKLREVEVVLDFEEGLDHIEAPGRDLNQIWTNLIDNAADAMEEGGTLTITAQNMGDNVVITVADTGTGMPAEVAERIFDPFYTTKEPGKGTGLGLHTVHSIIHRIGGEISVDTSPQGTTFTVTVPALH